MSRKNKTLRSFLHQNQNPTIEQAWDTAWKHAQKKFHARSMQDMEKQVSDLQAENEALRGTLSEVVSVAVTMLYDTHKLDVVDQFTIEELKDVVERTKHLQNDRVEDVYRRGYEVLLLAQAAELERQSGGGECARCSGSGVIPAAEKRIGTWVCKDCGGSGNG